jgi:hypothetical protein
MTKDAFHFDLQRRLAPGNYSMPFWASGKGGKGHPLEARLVVIGYNPSSAPPSWTCYWERKTGFNMAKYQQQHPKVSRTRKNIYDLVNSTIGSDATYVNTNIFWNNSARANLLVNKTLGDLAWLLNCLPSDVIVVAHGQKAKTAYAAMCSRDLGLPEAIPFYHLSGLGIPKGFSFKVEYSKLIKLVLEKARPTNQIS